MADDQSKEILDLYQRHLQTCGFSKELAQLRTSIPETRFDLEEYYLDILSGEIPRPHWADDPQYA